MTSPDSEIVNQSVIRGQVVGGKESLRSVLTPTLYLYALWWSQLSNGIVFVINSTLGYLLLFVTVSSALGQLKHELLQAQTIDAGSNRDQGEWSKTLTVCLMFVIVGTAVLLLNVLLVFYHQWIFISREKISWLISILEIEWLL